MSSLYDLYGRTVRHPRRRYSEHLRVLKQRHPGLAAVIRVVGRLDTEVPVWRSPDQAALYAVAGQMISGSAALTVVRRLLNSHGTPARAIEWAHRARHRHGGAGGLSRVKRRALSAWKTYREQHRGLRERWSGMDTDQVRDEIRGIYGFGPWSADMILVFYLGRMDVWPEGDLGLRRACREVLGTDDMNKVRTIIAGCETVAAIYLWEYLDRKLTLGTVSQGS